MVDKTEIDNQYINHKDSYTYRQILVGLRKEFLEFQKKLDRLRELSVVFGKDDYYYNLYKTPYSTELPELVVDKCIKEYDPKTLEALIYHLFFYNQPTRITMLRDNNGNYFPQRVTGNDKILKNQFAIFPKYQDNEEFIKLANEILDSDFANMMQLNSKISADTSGPFISKNSAIITPNLTDFGFCLRTCGSEIKYLGRHNIIKFSSLIHPSEEQKPLTQEHLDYVSTIKFPKEAFSEYHRSIIDNSIDDNRPIVLSEEYQPEIFTRLEIQDTPKQLVLTKTQSKRI